MPFHPHKEAATLDLGAENAPVLAYQQALDSEAELKRVQATILHVRSGIYQTYDQVLLLPARWVTHKYAWCLKQPGAGLCCTQSHTQPKLRARQHVALTHSPTHGILPALVSPAAWLDLKPSIRHPNKTVTAVLPLLSAAAGCQA